MNILTIFFPHLPSNKENHDMEDAATLASCTTASINRITPSMPNIYPLFTFNAIIAHSV